MPATSDISSDLLSALRSGGFAGELRFAVNPNTVVFQGTVNQTITDASFIQFAWDGALQGDYEDVVAGMTFFITETDDPVELRTPLLRGRVSRVPTSSIFYCNESGINLLDGYIVTVISNFEILQKDRIGNLVDGFQAFEELSPLVKGLKSFYYVEDATEGQFSLEAVMQVMAEGATEGTYLWTFPAGTTYDSGSSSTASVVVTVPYGHHWCYLDITDSNDTPFRFIFEILVCLRDDPAYMFTAHDDVTFEGGVESGWNCSTTFFAGVTGLLNRTRCAIVAFDLPKTGDPDLFDNVVFVGYIVQENTDISGDALSSTLSSTRFELQSFAAIAGQLPVPSLPIRDEATPTLWGDMAKPTLQRAAFGYIVPRYSTLANLCAIDVLYTDSTWYSDDIDFEEGTLLDTINRIGQEIQARLVFFPQGDACYEINGNFLPTAERNALPTLLASGNLDPQDVYSYSLPVPYYKTVGQVIAGCATFYTDGSDPYKLRAIAPATSRQEGNEKPVIMAQLLAANLSQADAKAAAKRRIGDLIEYLNPPVNLPAKYKDGWRILTPSTRVWLTYDLPATDSTRGLPVAPTKRYQLQSVSFTWRVENGIWDVSGTVRQETQGGLAQTGATISPNTIDTSLPVLPGLDDYGAFGADGTLNYLSTAPLDADLQPYDPFDLSQYEPMTTEDAANEADNMVGPKCTLLSPPVNFKSPETRLTPRPTVNGQRYKVTAKGLARISNDGWIRTFDMTSGLNGWAYDIDSDGAPIGNYVAGVGIVYTDNHIGAFYARGVSLILNQAIPSLTGVSTVQAITKGTFSDPSQPLWVVAIDGGLAASYLPAAVSDGTNVVLGASMSAAVATSLRIGIASNFQPTPTFTGSVTLKSITLTGTGANPFTGDPGGILYGDPFYYGPEDGEWELYPNGRGLLLNGLPISVPPEYNESHEYEFYYTGDGNQTPFTYYDTNYSDNQSKILYLKICGPGMGS